MAVTLLIPYHNTSAWALSLWYVRCRVEGRVHRFRSSRQRAGLQRACHPPKETSKCEPMIPLLVSALSLTSGTCSFSAWDEAASVVTVRFTIGVKALRLSGRARPLLSALVNMLAIQWWRRVSRCSFAKRLKFSVGRNALDPIGSDPRKISALSVAEQISLLHT